MRLSVRGGKGTHLEAECVEVGGVGGAATDGGGLQGTEREVGGLGVNGVKG
jgi:hypothetical protein